MVLYQPQSSQKDTVVRCSTWGSDKIFDRVDINGFYWGLFIVLNQVLIQNHTGICCTMKPPIKSVQIDPCCLWDNKRGLWKSFVEIVTFL